MEETNYFLCAHPLPAKVVEPNIVKIKGHNFTGDYPSPVFDGNPCWKNNVYSDQMPHYVASGLGLHCLPYNSYTGFQVRMG